MAPRLPEKALSVPSSPVVRAPLSMLSALDLTVS
jgi:hypothetical protein